MFGSTSRIRWAVLATVLAVAGTWAALAHAQAPAQADEKQKSEGRTLLDLPFPPPWHKHGGLYLAGSGGLAGYQKHAEANDDGSLSGISNDDTDLTWKLGAGFKFHYGGFEADYVDLGKARMKARSRGGTSWLAGNVTAGVHATGWLWTSFARYPIKDRWAALVKLGGFSWQSKEDFTEEGYGPSSDEDSGTTMTLGFGLEWDPGRLQHIVLRTEYDHLVVDADELPVNSLTFGIERVW
jgi:hypothetical protein